MTALNVVGLAMGTLRQRSDSLVIGLRLVVCDEHKLGTLWNEMGETLFMDTKN